MKIYLLPYLVGKRRIFENNFFKDIKLEKIIFKFDLFNINKN